MFKNMFDNTKVAFKNSQFNSKYINNISYNNYKVTMLVPSEKKQNYIIIYEQFRVFCGIYIN